MDDVGERARQTTLALFDLQVKNPMLGNLTPSALALIKDINSLIEQKEKLQSYIRARNSVLRCREARLRNGFKAEKEPLFPQKTRIVTQVKDYNDLIALARRYKFKR